MPIFKIALYNRMINILVKPKRKNQTKENQKLQFHQTLKSWTLLKKMEWYNPKEKKQEIIEIMIEDLIHFMLSRKKQKMESESIIDYLVT